MSRASFAVGLFAVALFAAGACGGRAALEAYDLDETGSGGDTSSGTQMSSMQTSMQTSSSQPTQQSSSTSINTDISSSTGPVGECDFSGDCGSCSQCAFNGPCDDLWQTCFNSQPCVEFMSCFETCQGQPGCFLGCAQDNEEGAQMWLSALQCIACVECASDCAGQFPPQVCN